MGNLRPALTRARLFGRKRAKWLGRSGAVLSLFIFAFAMVGRLGNTLQSGRSQECRY